MAKTMPLYGPFAVLSCTGGHLAPGMQIGYSQPNLQGHGPLFILITIRFHWARHPLEPNLPGRWGLLTHTKKFCVRSCVRLMLLENKLHPTNLSKYGLSGVNSCSYHVGNEGCCRMRVAVPRIQSNVSCTSKPGP